MEHLKHLLTAIIAAGFIAPAWAGDEIPASLQKKYERRLEEMKAFDKNNDGVLQAEELQGSVETKFDAADINQDGVVSPEEREAAIGSFKDGAQETYKATADKRSRRLENRYNDADANEDGQVSEKEYNDYFGGRYLNFDRNGDGVITEKEYRSDTEKVPRSYMRED